jgi:hypothetical protein
MLKPLLIAFITLTSAIAVAQTSVAEVESAVAQTLEGTIRTVAHRESADGVLRACGIEFSALTRDFSTKGGAPVMIVGSFYLRSNEKIVLGYGLKLGFIDGLGSKRPVAPANAFIRAPRGNAPKKAIRVDADTPEYALFAGALDDEVIAAYTSIIEQSQLVVGFNRRLGQQDVTATLDLTVIDVEMRDGKAVRQHSGQPVSDFAACSADLMKTIQIPKSK